jgi:hypothetical protein
MIAVPLLLVVLVVSVFLSRTWLWMYLYSRLLGSGTYRTSKRTANQPTASGIKDLLVLTGASSMAISPDLVIFEAWE